MKKILSAALLLCLVMALTIGVASAATLKEVQDAGWYIEKMPTCTEEGTYRYPLTAAEAASERYAEIAKMDKVTGTYYVPRVIVKLGHTWIWEHEHDADDALACETVGKIYEICAVCGEKSGETSEVLAPGHTWVTKEVKKADCVSVAEYETTCKVCGAAPEDSKMPKDIAAVAAGTLKKETKGTSIDKTNHKDPQPWIIDVEATCYSKGHYHSQCNACWAMIEADYGPVDHERELNPVTINEATCLSNGLVYYYCIYECGTVVDTKELPKADHDWTNWTAHSEDHNADGSGDDSHVVYIRECKSCGALARYIDVNGTGKPADTVQPDLEGTVCREFGHNFITLEAVAPTTTKVGLTAGEICSICGFVSVPQEVIPKLVGKTAIVDNKLIYTTDGKTPDTSFTGLADFEGGTFFIRNGVLDTSVNGAQKPGSTWYFFANGQVQKQFSGWTYYDGQHFVVTNGALDFSVNGMATFMGEKFLVAEGRVVKEYSGLYLNGSQWIYLSHGQFYAYTGVVEHNGSYFEVVDGVMK